MYIDVAPIDRDLRKCFIILDFPFFRVVLASSPPDPRSVMHPAVPTSSHMAPAVSTRHPVTGYGGATESIYPAADQSAPYPAYNQRGLVKSNSVDIYRLSESPNHAHGHAVPSHTASNAFPAYGEGPFHDVPFTGNRKY